VARGRGRIRDFENLIAEDPAGLKGSRGFGGILSRTGIEILIAGACRFGWDLRMEVARKRHAKEITVSVR
jgi:hypothetical protein